MVMMGLRTKSGFTAGRNRTKPKGRCLKKGSAIAKKKPAHERKRAGARVETSQRTSGNEPAQRQSKAGRKRVFKSLVASAGAAPRHSSHSDLQEHRRGHVKSRKERTPGG